MMAEAKAETLLTAEELLQGEAPSEVRVDQTKTNLTLVWADGKTHRFPAAFLRNNSQSAGSKKLRLQNWAVPASENLSISAINPIGSYAINIVFSDGYDRAIYPWAYLLQLSEKIEEDS